MADAPPSTAGHDAASPEPPTCSRRDHAAQPARPLGPKARIRHQRRPKRWAPARTLDATVLSSDDSSIACVLRHSTDGVAVQRCECRDNTLTELYLAFTSATDYKAWCDADILREAAPELHRQLRQYGEEHFDAVG
jgi:hypothetical protein